jgi:thiamine-monophosphate kinase
VARPGKRRPGEFELIDRYFRPLAHDPGAFALKDDAAVYRPRPDEDVVATADMLVAGVHFLPDDPPESIARKALRVNLSDLAAKGAEPFGYFLSLALPQNWTERWVRAFSKGLAADQSTYSVSLLGGDTTRADRGLTIAVTALGRVPTGGTILRSGAKAGDAIFVTGTIGDAALALKIKPGMATATARRHFRERYLHPRPRTALVPVLRRHATAAIDVSDGLIGDLAHICETSSVGAEVNAHDVPLSPAAAGVLKARPRLLSLILNGGDDYEILATVPESSGPAFADEAEDAGVPVSRIGRIVPGSAPPVVRNALGKPIRLTTASHTHF